MRLATFNVEDLFRRPVVLDQPSWADGREQLNDYTKFNGIIGKASYSSADKRWLVDFLDRYGMADRRIGAEDPFQRNEVRGKLFKVPRGETKAEIIVDGRGDWDGWLELRKHNVNHIAIENAARVVEALRNHLKTMNKHVYDTKAMHQQTGSVPDSLLLSSRIELKSPDTWTTTPAFFLQPSAA